MTYITTPEFNNLTAGAFTARVAQADLVTKTQFDTKLQSLNKRITSNKTKHLLLENELKKTTNVIKIQDIWHRKLFSISANVPNVYFKMVGSSNNKILS